MPATGLLALLDDITTILDDVAALSKVAAQKTAGIAGDDLAVGAEGLVGLEPSRELPIVGKVALGSLVNKAILVPIALALPHAAIAPLLMIGGTFLCYEGFHKVYHRRDAEDEAHDKALVEAVQAGPDALREIERKKVRQAILTDFVLSAEIVAVGLSAVADEPLATRAMVLVFVSVAMTIGIYGIVAGLVKLDDVGLHLQRGSTEGRLRWRIGGGIVAAVPRLMSAIGVIGTIAMFLVGGGILAHGIPALGHGLDRLAEGVGSTILRGLVTGLSNVVIGLLLGALATGVVVLLRGAWRRVRGTPANGMP